MKTKLFESARLIGSINEVAATVTHEVAVIAARKELQEATVLRDKIINRGSAEYNQQKLINLCERIRVLRAEVQNS